MKKHMTLLLNYSNEFLIYFYIKLLKVKFCSLFLVGLEKEEYAIQLDELYNSFSVSMEEGICYAVVEESIEGELLEYLFRCCSSFSGSVAFPVKPVGGIDFLESEFYELWGTGDYAANRRVILDECIETLEKHLKKRGVEV